MSDTTSKIGHKRHTQCKGKLAPAASVIATKRISAAVAGLSLLALVLLRLCPVFHPILIPMRLVPAFVLFLFLPGFILLNWLLPEMVQSFVETVPLAFGVSLAFWAPVIFGMLVLAVSPTMLLLVVLLALLVLFVAYLILASNVDEREIRLAPTGREFWLVWCGMALTWALMIGKGANLFSGVVRKHLPIMRRVVDGTHLSLGYVTGSAEFWGLRSYIFPLWHIVGALISLLAGIEPVHVSYYESSLLVPISVLGIYLLAQVLFKNNPIACLSTPVYLLISFYSHGGRPFRRWLCISYPRDMNWLVFLPVVLTVLVHYLRCQSSRVWTLGGAVFALGFVMGTIHASDIFFMLAWLVIFLVTYPILVGWNWQVLVRAAGIVLIFALSFVVVFWFADTWLAPDHDLSYLGTVQQDNESAARPSGYGSYVDIAFPYLVLPAMALFPLLLAIGPETIPFAIAFMFAGLIAPHLLHLEPHILSVAMQVIPNFQRLSHMVPFHASVLIITATVGALRPLLDRRIVHPGVLMVRRTSVWTRRAGFLAICTTGALAIWVITRCQFLKDYVLRERLELSPLFFFAYLALVASLAMWTRFRLAKSDPLGMVSRAQTAETELRYPLLTVTVIVTCLVLLAIPGLSWLQPIKGPPLLESNMNTEAMSSRFFGAVEWWDPELINFLRDHTPEDAVIYSERKVSQLIPSYVNRRSWQVNWADIERVEKLRLRVPTYVVLARPSSAPPTDMNDLLHLSRAFRADGGLFERVYESAQVMLFRMSPASQGTAELQLNHVLAANAHFVEEEWDKAIAEYEVALTLDPDDPLAHLGLGQVYQAQGEMEKAIAELEQAAASPEDASLHFYLGQAYASLAEMAEANGQIYLQRAAEAYGRSVALNWENTAAGERLAEMRGKLGDWCQQAGIFDEVVVHFEKAVESDPRDGELQLTLAHWYKAAGRYEEAVAAYLRAADLRPRDADVYVSLSDAYISLGAAYLDQHRVDDAEAAFERAIELEPVQANVSVAQLCEREGWMDKAIVHYLAAADAAGGYMKAILLGEVARIYEAQGQLDRAIAQYLAAAQATADSGTMRASYRRVADMYLAAGNPEGARSLVRSVLWNERRNAGSWSLAMDVYPALIEWYEAQGEIVRARVMAWDLLTIAPRHEAALQALTYYDFLENFSTAEVEAPDEPFPYVRFAEFTMPATGDQRAVLFMLPLARVSYKLKVPSEPSVLRFSLAMNPETWDLGGDGSTFEVHVTDEGGANRSLFSEHVGNDPEEQKWHDRDVSLAPYAGQEVTITFVTQPGPADDFTGDEAGWANPRVMWAQTDEQDFWDFSEAEIAAAETLETSPSLFTTLYPLD